MDLIYALVVIIVVVVLIVVLIKVLNMLFIAPFYFDTHQEFIALTQFLRT